MKIIGTVLVFLALVAALCVGTVFGILVARYPEFSACVHSAFNLETEPVPPETPRARPETEAPSETPGPGPTERPAPQKPH